MALEDLLSARIHRIDTSEIRKVFDLAARIENPINLSIGQPDFPVPDPVKEAIIQAIKDDKMAYTVTQGIVPLREKISEMWQTRGGFKVDPGNIVVSTGVASLLFLLFEAMFDPGDELLLIDPYFLIHDSLAHYHQLKTHYLPETFSKDDIEQLQKENPSMNLKAIIFSSPSNPTGKILSKEQLHQLTSLAESQDAIIVSDEIYEAYDFDDKFTFTASMLPERTVTLGGFSKSHAMTGLRVGYMGVPDRLREIAQKVATLQQYSIVCAPQVAQWGALKALEVPIHNELNIMRRRREIVLKHLKGKAEFTHPDGAFYVFPRVPGDCSAFVEKAIGQKLLIVPGHIFSQKRDSVRISYAQKEEVLEQGLEIFTQLLQG